MKRLFSILLMNAWSGIRHMPGLSTAVMVLVSVMALIVASNVTAGASPDSALSSQLHSTSVAAHSVSSKVLAFFGDDNSSAPHAPKKVQKPTDQDKTKQIASKQGATATSDGSSNNNSPNQSGTSGAQSAPATLALAMAQQTCDQGQTTYTYSIASATLSFQSPTAADGTVAWQWETQTSNGTNTPNTPTVVSSGSQPALAGTSQVKLTAADSSQPFFSKTADMNYTYRVRLHITGPVDIASSWVTVSAPSTCTPSQKTNN